MLECTDARIEQLKTAIDEAAKQESAANKYLEKYNRAVNIYENSGGTVKLKDGTVLVIEKSERLKPVDFSVVAREMLEKAQVEIQALKAELKSTLKFGKTIYFAPSKVNQLIAKLYSILGKTGGKILPGIGTVLSTGVCVVDIIMTFNEMVETVDHLYSYLADVDRWEEILEQACQNNCLKDGYSADQVREKLAEIRQAMRLLAVAKADGNNDSANLTLICVISIRDNVRKEAADAIKEVQNAGIQVVMVTGDRKETAVAIAKEAGLLSAPEDVALTSAEMAEKSDEELKAILPHLRVVSRALPTDKSRLVRIAQELNMVVGMTGDGVNDSPALKKADVGFAMGSGTEVAKEAGDITILDDNFSSIEKAILYGRTMFKSIRKFLIFQLTVNVAAVLTCFLGPLMGENVILTVIQLLLINLAMDTLAAIAFGSEPALKEYMKDKPVPRSESIISKEMMTEILVGALYITQLALRVLRQ